MGQDQFGLSFRGLGRLLYEERRREEEEEGEEDFRYVVWITMD